MRKRAEQVEETKGRITEAAMRLHTTVGPSNTTITAVAEEADVTRLTVYRHFSTEEELFLACSSHWSKLHPGPEPGEWLAIDGLEARARYAISETYRFYAENHEDLSPILRDIEHMPVEFQSALRSQLAEMGEALVTGSRVLGRRRAALLAVCHLVLGFSSWHVLVVESKLDSMQAEELALGFIMSV